MSHKNKGVIPAVLIFLSFYLVSGEELPEEDRVMKAYFKKYKELEKNKQLYSPFFKQ